MAKEVAEWDKRKEAQQGMRASKRFLITQLSACRRDLVAKEAAEAERRKEERRRKERKNRDAFTALLRQHLADGRLTAKMRWKVGMLCNRPAKP